MTTALEKDVFALLQPGGPLTVETIAYDLSVNPPGDSGGFIS